MPTKTARPPAPARVNLDSSAPYNSKNLPEHITTVIDHFVSAESGIPNDPEDREDGRMLEGYRDQLVDMAVAKMNQDHRPTAKNVAAFRKANDTFVMTYSKEQASDVLREIDDAKSRNRFGER